jgi:hypothetical protein
MLNDINKIIETVGGNRKKLITLIILLCFIGAFYVFKTLSYKDDCSGLIEQNEKILEKNLSIMNVNNKLMDNNISLTERISILEELISKKDSILMKERNRFLSHRNLTHNNINQSDNIVTEEVVENNTDELISHNRVYYQLEDSIVVVENLENDSLNTEMYKDTLEIEPKKEKRNFFQRIFKKRK